MRRPPLVGFGILGAFECESTLRSELLARPELDSGSFGLLWRPFPKAPPFGRGLFTLVGRFLSLT